jgi:hypothetical protein
VGYFGSGAGTRALWTSSSDVDIHHCRIHHTTGDGIFIDNNSQIALQNVAILDSGWSGLSIMGGSRIDGKHLSLARNGGGVYVAAGGTAALTNTILAQNTTGVNVVSGGSATLTYTLWDNNTTPTVGTVNETGHVDGPANLDADGYHLTRYSAALEQGFDAGVTDDIDGQARPLPVGTLPDLGADEYAYSPGTEFVAEKIAFEPQWVVDAAHPYGRLQQRYLIRYYYGSTDPTPPDLTVTVTDTLPADLVLRSESHNPAMSFQQQGQQLTWQTTAPVQYGQSGEIQIVTIYDDPEPGRTLTNTAALSAGAFHFDLQATTQVPIIAPFIVSPGNGELCPGSVTISGTAQAGVTVTVYANSSPVAQALTDENGIFAATYNYPGGNVTLKAQACASGGACSADSNAVALTSSLSFWCPQRSTWEGTPSAGPLAGQHLVYRFRDGTGKFATHNWVIPGVYGFWDTTLHLYVCDCPPSSGTTAPPSSVWVVADGVRYDDPSPSLPWYDFAIAGGAHTVHFYAQCGDTVVDDGGTIVIDPDGYVFDVTQGFTPTLHAVSGVTVTCMISMTEWGGWVPWPAHLYNNQVNPQVTGADGYFAFFTPPGLYYLQVEGKSGYQSWRSPAIEVITQIVHVNVPYTPWPTGDASQVTLTSNGPDPTVITVSVGSAVQWAAEVSSSVPPEELARLTENPALRPLSTLDPLTDTHAWDGGMMAPGRAYQRQFATPGTYSYTDGMGHTGQVIVRAYVYLPLVLREYPSASPDRREPASAQAPYRAELSPSDRRDVATAAVLGLAGAPIIAFAGRSRKKPTASRSCGRPPRTN